MKYDAAIDTERARRNAEAAKFMREHADRFERGEVLDCVVIWNDREEQVFGSWFDFKDKWRLLGALEFIKVSVATGGLGGA